MHLRSCDGIYSTRFIMRIMIWNARGLGKTYRRSLVKNHIIQEDLDVMAIQETIKQHFSDWELKEMVGNRDFLWFCQSARGHSRGLIVGVKSEMFEVEEYIKEDYFLGVLLR